MNGWPTHECELTHSNSPIGAPSDVPPWRTLVMYASGANGFRFNVTEMFAIGERSATDSGGMRSIRFAFHDMKVYTMGCEGRTGGT